MPIRPWAWLERFHNSPALSGVLQGGSFLVKKPLGGYGPGYSNCGTAGVRSGRGYDSSLAKPELLQESAKHANVPKMLTDGCGVELDRPAFGLCAV